MRGQSLNDQDRWEWVQNDEGLYLWWRSEQRRGVSKTAFIRENRAELDAHIIAVRDAPPSR